MIRIIKLILSKIRIIVFWLLETVKKSELKKAYGNLQKSDNMDSTSKEFIKIQNTSLLKLLNHASTTTEYYSNKSTKKIIYDFPVINKNIIRDKQNEFISNKYKLEELITMSTSGSTGTPFVSYQNFKKKERVHAEVIFFSKKAGYNVGENLIFMRALTSISAKPKIKQWLQNETLVDISKLDDASIKILLETIERKSSKIGSVLLAYASTYDALKEYYIRNIDFDTSKSYIKGIISSSEMLFDDTRITLSKMFNCECFSRYANQENGVLGQDNPDNPNTFILNEAHYFFEVLNFDNNKPAKGEDVGRIVVTDLYNYAMPMIRYDTGDVGTLTSIKIKGVNKKAIKNFGGRIVDSVYDSNGNRLSPHTITNNFWEFPEIKQFQFIQKNKNEYEILLNVSSTYERLDELKKLTKKMLGNKAIIKLKFLNDIPVLSSGKRQYIINESKKEEF